MISSHELAVRKNQLFNLYYGIAERTTISERSLNRDDFTVAFREFGANDLHASSGFSI
jgi:hypothetical protein